MSANIATICWHEKHSFWHTLGKTQVHHFVSELCLSWQNETCCSASAYCCVQYMPPTGAPARSRNICIVFSLTQITKGLCVRWHIDRVHMSLCVHVCVMCLYACNTTKEFTVFQFLYSTLFQLLGLSFLSLSLFSVSISTASNCFLAVKVSPFPGCQTVSSKSSKW